MKRFIQRLLHLPVFLKAYTPSPKKCPIIGERTLHCLALKRIAVRTTNKGTASAPDEIRKKLYHLKKGTGAYRIVDLGNLNIGHDLSESYVRVSEVCRMLLEHNVLPIILGGSHDIDYGQYCAYETMDKLVSLLNIDAFLDLEEKRESPESRHHIHKILLHEPNYLFSYTHLAYQSYLIDPQCCFYSGKIILRSISRRTSANEYSGNRANGAKC